MLKIIFIKPVVGRYSLLGRLTESFAAALSLNAHFQVEVWSDDKRLSTRQKLDQIASLKGDYTFCFNSFVFLGEEAALSEVTGIPHIAYLIDSPYMFWPLPAKGKYFICCVNREDKSYYDRVFPEARTLFLPHAAELSHHEDREKDWDLLFVGTCMDPDYYKERWSRSQLTLWKDLAERALERACRERAKPYEEILNEVLKGVIDPGQRKKMELWRYLDRVVQGMDRLELMKAITKAPLHLFGGQLEGRGWKELLVDKKEILFEGEIPYSQVSQVMSRTKILFHGCATFKGALHERLLNGMAAGALVIAEESPFLKESFESGKEIIFFDPRQPKQADELAGYYLSRLEEMKRIAQAGQKKVLAMHTWKNRAELFSTFLESHHVS